MELQFAFEVPVFLKKILSVCLSVCHLSVYRPVFQCLCECMLCVYCGSCTAEYNDEPSGGDARSSAQVGKQDSS